MAELFNELEIAEVKRETPNAVSVSFNIPESLKSDYQFIAGQYLTLEATINGESIRRAYSLCSNANGSDAPRVAIKRVDGGRMSNHVNDNFKAGDKVNVMKPLGNFKVVTNSSNAKTYVLVAGGSGITPMLSIIKTVLAEESNSKLVLIYANTDKENIIFHDEIESIVANNADRLSVHYSLDNGHDGWTGHTGFLTSDLLLSITSDLLSTAHFYTCGPAPLMEMTLSTLEGKGVDASRLNVEYFTAKAKEDKVSIVDETDEEIVDREVIVINDGNEKTITVEADSNILDASIDNDLDPPYACQAGVCTTCRAKLISGKVVMDEMEGLSDDEIEEGYILTCQSHPLTDDVKVEYSMM